MRPRVFPAEDRLISDAILSAIKSFNEAAGIPRGRLLPLGGKDSELEPLQ